VVYGTDGETLAQVVVRKLLASGQTLALAETATGGRVARDLLAAPGGDQALAGVRVALDGVMLAQQVGLSSEADDQALARAIAQGLRKACAADVSMAILDAGQEGAACHVAFASAKAVKVRTWPSRGYAEYAIARSANYALDRVRRWL
jgi:nicotinamide mononucleotide (NMN) deamidase PncC